MAPSTDLQSDEGRQVHECVAGYAGDGIVVQLPADKNRLAVNGEMCISTVARDCESEECIAQ